MSDPVRFQATVHPTANWFAMDADTQVKLVLVVPAQDAAQVMKLVLWTRKRLNITVEADEEKGE